jgi:CobQ-like glutamine amidotransferase family enzyme
MLLNICHLYPDLLNIYGDRGNIICLLNRCQWRGIKVKISNISLNDQLKPKKYDLFFGGGGQDRQQLLVSQDLQKKKKALKQEADRGAPILTVCGTYQLFGHYFKAHDKTKIPGISIFDAYTIASNIRKMGNIVVKINPKNLKLSHSKTLSLVGFENHWGNTFLNKTAPLGKVIKGGGNNSEDKTEGAVYKNVIGTYLHGPILPKNPHLADWLIKKALEVKYGRKTTLKPLNDSLEWQAHQKAVKRA